MPNPLQKSLKGYMSKIKRETGSSLSSSKKWVLAGPKKIALSFKHKRRTSNTRFKDADHLYQEPGHAATLSDIDRFLQENFKSLCIRDDDDEGRREDSSDEHDRFERTWGSPDEPESSEGRHSIDTTPRQVELPENCIAVLRCTTEPHEDFRQSMVEMTESKLGGREVDWDLMEEMLFCYLDLNDKKSHRFILSAFADLVIALRDKEKRITGKGLARERLIKRMTITDAFPN